MVTGTVQPLNKETFRTSSFVLSREVVLFHNYVIFYQGVQ